MICTRCWTGCRRILSFEVTGIEGTWKLNQNKPDDVRERAAKQVAAYGQGLEIQTLAALMLGAK